MRFGFCKKLETLEAAAGRFGKLTWPLCSESCL
jgi:hypothetical protein